jgi:membrane protein required for colicin V production
MIWIDWLILLVILLSAVVSVVRGFFREAISLTGWIIAIWLGLAFSGDIAAQLAKIISVPSVRIIMAFSMVLVFVLVLTALAGHFATLVVKKTGLTGTDRVLGVVFGVARGAVIVGILVLLAGLTALPKDPWWREATLIPHFQRLAVHIRGMLPAEVADEIRF